MISEKDLAGHFSDFWEELLPLLTPKFVHLFNEGFRRVLCDDNGREIPEVPRSADSDGASAMIAEFAYYLVEGASERGLNADLAYEDEALREAAEQRALVSVGLHSQSNDLAPARLMATELSEGLDLARNYFHFFRIKALSDQICFQHRLPGAGFLASCRADLTFGSSMFEVKTVNRNIAGKDIRQVLVYLSLQAQLETERWRTAGIFNPRRALYFEFEIDRFIPLIAGGKSATEVFRELLDFTSSRDVQIDSPF